MWKRAFAAAALTAACGVPSTPYRQSLAAFDDTPSAAVPVDDGEALFDGVGELAPDALARAALARNPSIEAARQAWRAALARFDDATSFDDPRLVVSTAPLSFASTDVQIGVSAEISQPLPWFGKRQLRGAVVAAEAEARRDDYEAVRQRLALMATDLYYQLYLVDRALDINADHIALLGADRAAITARLEAGRAWREDALKLDVDLAELRTARASLEATRRVTVAQINALLHRRPDAPLPPPPAELPPPPPIDAAPESLVARALARRPELRALAHERDAAAASVALARRDDYPDVRVIAKYNRMWPMLEHQIMVGLAVDLPLQRARRAARVEVARARVARTDAERERFADSVREQVQTALARAQEADDSAALYRDRALPAARGRVDAIRQGLDANRTEYVEVIRAERELRTVALRYHEAIAAAYRWRAHLAWALGDVAAGGQP